MAGVVTLPRTEQIALRQVEFLPLTANRVLVILVVNERDVQNRVIHTDREYSESELVAVRQLHQSRVRRCVAPDHPRGADRRACNATKRTWIR